MLPSLTVPYLLPAQDLPYCISWKSTPLQKNIPHLFQFHHHRQSLKSPTAYSATSYLSKTQVLSCLFCPQASMGSLVLGVKFILFSMVYKLLINKPWLSNFIFPFPTSTSFIYCENKPERWVWISLVSQIKKTGPKLLAQGPTAWEQWFEAKSDSKTQVLWLQRHHCFMKLPPKCVFLVTFFIKAPWSCTKAPPPFSAGATTAHWALVELKDSH